MATLPKSRQTQSVFTQSLSPGTVLQVGTTLGKANVITGRHRDDNLTALMDSVKQKLVRDPNVEIKRDYNTGEYDLEVDSDALENTIHDTALSISEAKNQLDALPNLGLTKDVIISSVLSPNDMMSTELIYANDSDLFGDVAPVLIDVIQTYFDDEYELPTLLGPWLEQSLFIEGATALAVVPESAIDHAINTNLKITQESLSSEFDSDGLPKSIGNLRTPRYQKIVKKPAKTTSSIAFESFSVDADVSYESRVGAGSKWDFGVTVTDNPNVLKMPLINEKIRQDRLAEIYGHHGFGVESFKQNLFKPEENSNFGIYPDRTTNVRPILTLKTLDDLEKKTQGHPVVFQFPTEAVIPVYSPSDPSEHVCYFLAVDENGNPIRMDQNHDQYRSMEQNFNNSVNGSAASSLISSAGAMGMSDIAKKDTYGSSEMASLYSRVVEQDLMQRMDSGGFHGRDLKIGKANELYKLMFVRALAQMNTQLVFIPKELMTYIAFDYKPNGVGRSLLDKTKILGSLRMVEVMTSAIANTKSSIDHRVINIEIDPEDPDPMKRVTQYLHEFQRATKAAFPMGINSFADITDYLQKAGVQVKVSGHEGMPNMGMEVNNQRMDYNKPDDMYREKLDKDHIMAMGAPPESIRSAEDIQFATNIISGNVYFAKISMWRQKTYSTHLSDHIQKYTRNSQPLMTELTNLIKLNRAKLTKIDEKYTDEAIAIVFANNMVVSLPKPDMAQNAMQLEAFEKYNQILDIALPAFVSEELFADINLGEKLGPAMQHIVSVLKAHFMRKWLIDNNVLPELFDLVNTTTDAEERFDFLKDHTKRLDDLAPAVRDYLVKSIKRSTFSDGVIEKAEELTGGEQNDFDGGSGGDSFGSNDGDSDFGGDGDTDDSGDSEQTDGEGGDDDFNFDI